MDHAEQDLKRRVAAAERARVYIDDPLLVAAFEALDARMLMGWRATQPTDTAGREALWHQTQALAMVRAQLNDVLTDGVMAKAALDDMHDGTDTNP